jgi:hypothetical protein
VVQAHQGGDLALEPLDGRGALARVQLREPRLTDLQRVDPTVATDLVDEAEAATADLLLDLVGATKVPGLR